VGRPGPDPATATAATVYRRWWLAATDVVDAAAAQASVVSEGSLPGLLDRQH
jgi:hypothetical protein